MECFRCGVPDSRALLYDAISPDGIIKVCKKCLPDLDFPIIRKSAESQLEEVKEKTTVREVLERLSGIKPALEKTPEKKQELKKQETALQEIVNKNLPGFIRATAVPTDQFIDNFHWIIMRARRLKKLTQKELAQEIEEQEVAVKMAEQGIISKQTPHLIEKIENYLGIHLKKDQGEKLMQEINHKVQRELFPVKKSIETLQREEVQKYPKSKLSFDPMVTKSMTIADLRVIKEKREGDVLKRTFEKEEQKETKKEKPLDERGLSDEERDDLIFWGK